MDEPRGTDGNATGRRAVLKSVASAGAAGVSLPAVASASRPDRAGDWNAISFRAAENGTLTFQLVVSGGIDVRGGNAAGVVDSDVQVANNVAQGSVSNGDRRRFRFTGSVTVLQVDGLGTVRLNGEVVRDTTGAASGSASPSGNAASESSSGPTELPKVVVVSSPGTDRQRDYAFEVTGDLVDLEPDEDSGNARDEIRRVGDRVRVDGTVGTGDDRFAFSGTFIPVEKPPDVQFDVRKR